MANIRKVEKHFFFLFIIHDCKIFKVCILLVDINKKMIIYCGTDAQKIFHTIIF